MGEPATGPRIGVFSVHGISRHEPLQMAADVTDGISAWLRQRTGRAWHVGFEEPVVGPRRRRLLPRFVIASDDPSAPTVAVSESNWSELTRDRFPKHTLRRWVDNVVASAGEATRAVNRKTEFELIYVLGPLVAVALGALTLLVFVTDTSLRAGAAVVPLLLFAALALCSLGMAVVAPFVPLARRKLRLFSEERARHEALPFPFRDVAALAEASTAPPSDPANVVLVLKSVLVGALGCTGWLVAAFMYAMVVLGRHALQALTRVSRADLIAFLVLALTLRFGRGALRRLGAVYERLEDIYAYADPSCEARRTRDDMVRLVTADLQRFLAESRFDAVILTGHSLGSVLLLDAIAEIERDVVSGRYDRRHVSAVHAIVLYGSPFSKILAQIRAIDPRRFATELLRCGIVLRVLSDVAKRLNGAWCFNFYYLTDVVAEKIVTDDDSIANFKLRSPLRPWSHDRYHDDRAFWSAVFEAAGLRALFDLPPPVQGSSDDAARFAVPSRWSQPTWRQLLLGFTKAAMFLVAMRFALAHGANPNLTIVLVTVFWTVMVFTIRD